MKRKSSVATDLRVFMARVAAKKRQHEPENVIESCNESHMQIVLFQGQSGSGTSTVPPEPREQDIVNAMDFLEFTKVELDVLRQDSGWQEFLTKVTSFCEKHNVKVVDMNGKYIPMQRSKQFYRGAINYHRFYVDMFLVSLIGKFKSLIIGLMRNDENFKNLNGLAELSMMLVKQGKVARYEIVYKLLKLVLVLPVATAGVERVFSIMNLIKNKRRSKMGQKYLNGCLVTLIEREFFMQAKDKNNIAHFQSIKDRKVVRMVGEMEAGEGEEVVETGEKEEDDGVVASRVAF
ncbi:unnamed protein product [Miscanthus lutarioriparius]|uniref:HAT C-terminal dimerisation domain-containing protein n=1 Tax=Miscanthus lutarioriparius TaxID=422564 RepID=A0A811MH85_9POAL|nr:unnamed protein product [Miscanthus lutarioriparius]